MGGLENIYQCVPNTIQGHTQYRLSVAKAINQAIGYIEDFGLNGTVPLLTEWEPIG